MRSGLDISGALHLWRCNERTQDYGGPSPKRRFDLEFTAHQRGTLTHANQASTLTVYLGDLWLEADAVVLDNERQMVGGVLEHDVNMGRTRVLCDVIECFLCEPVDRGFKLGCYAIQRRRAHVQLNANADMLRPAVHVVRQRSLQAEGLNLDGPQFPHAKSDILIELHREGFERFDLHLDLAFDGLRFEHFQSQPE